MALQFPDSPSQGDSYVASNGVVYTYENGGWTANPQYVSNLNGGPLAGFRNLLINGDFRVWQRASSSTDKGYKTADRWFVEWAGTSATVEKVLNGTNYRLKVTGSSLSQLSLEQRIEAYDVRRFLGKTMTLSFYTTAPAPEARIDTYNESQSGTVVKNWDGSQPLTSLGNNRWSYTFTVTVSGTHLGTVPTSRGMDVMITPVQRGLDATGTFEFWDIQLEEGPVATPFEHRPYGTELALCQRYYQKIESLSFSGRTGNTASAADGFRVPFPFSTMRANPTTTASWSWSSTPGTVSVTVRDPGLLDLTAYGAANTFYAPNTALLTLDAEL